MKSSFPFLLFACFAGFAGHFAYAQTTNVIVADPGSGGGFGEVVTNDGLTGASFEEPTVSPAQSEFGVAGETMSAAALSPDGIPSSYAPEIRSIVVSCQADPKKLFDFVRNNVRYTPYYGFRKGAVMTWLTRSGNDADQAELLVTLLRAAGYSADYERGWLYMPSTEARAWFGAQIGNATDPNIGLNRITASAGYQTDVSSAAQFGIIQIIARVTIDGISYRLHPAYKTLTNHPGIDLTAATGYQRNLLLSAAGGTETAGSTFAQGVSDVGVTNYLRDRAMNLVATVRSTYPNTSVGEIVGERRVVVQDISGWSQAFPAIATFTRLGSPFSQPPNSYCATLRIAIGPFDGSSLTPVLDRTYTTRSLEGRRISVAFDQNSDVQLWLDDALQASAPAPLASGPIGLAMIIDHPYGNTNSYDQTRIVRIQRGGTYTVIANLGGSDQPEIAKRRRAKIEQYQRQGLTNLSREIASESLNLLGLDWMRQWETGAKLLSQQADFEFIYHHSLALMSQESSFTVDIPLTAVTVSRDGDLGKTYANLRGVLLLASAMEHGVIEQSYPGRKAVSTIQYVRRNNVLGKKTYFATPANYSTINADSDFVAGWTQSERAKFGTTLSAGSPWNLIIPQDGAQRVDQLIGNGHFESREGAVAAMISKSGYVANGGYTTTEGQIDPGQNPTPVQPTEGPASQKNPESKEPIDLLSGAYVFDRVDLSLSGEGVRGLSLSRHYSSASSGVPSEIGAGWNHSYRSFVTEHSDAAAVMGRSTAEQAAAMITVCHVLTDLMRSEQNTAKGWIIGSITAGWAMDQVLDNSVSMTAMRKNYSFVRLPDGSYASPPGVTAKLIKASGVYRVEERFGRIMHFDEQRRLASYVDADGKALTLNYDPVSGRLENVKDCYDRVLTFAYYATGTSQGLIQTVTDSTQRSVSYTYTAARQLVSATDPEGHTTRFEYDPAGRIWRVYNEADEMLAENTYDDQGRVVQQMGEGDPEQTWHYAYTGHWSVEINPAGNVNTHIFDEKGRNTGFIDGAGNRTLKRYDGQDHLVEIVDGRGKTTILEYDGRHNLRKVTNGEGHTTENVYDLQDRLDYSLDGANKRIADYAYDNNHHLTEVKDGRNRVTTLLPYLSGPHTGLLWKRVENNNDTTIFSYDSKGFPDTITRADNSVMDVTYNAHGDLLDSKITTAGDSHLHAVALTYDRRRLRLTTRDALGFGETDVYDPRGLLASHTARDGSTTRLTYSPMGRMQTSTSPSNAVTVFRNDTSGRRDQVTDARRQTTNSLYDGAGRLATVTNALNHEMSFGYDSAGNRNLLANTRGKQWNWTHTGVNTTDTLTSPGGRAWDYDYNTRDLLQSIKEPSLQSSAWDYYDDRKLEQMIDPTGTINYLYDTKGRLDTVTENGAVLDRDWDELDRLEKFTDGDGNAIGYRYDGAGNLTELTYPGNKKITYSYDAADRLDFMTDWAQRTTDFIYDPKSRLSGVAFPNGTKRIFGYDWAGRRNLIRDETATGEIISKSVLEYDELDRIKNEIALPMVTAADISPASMTYDDDDRLATWNGQACASDADGNLTTGPLNGSLATFGYDARNRLTSAGGTTYTYDAENRRTSQTTAGAITTYLHDPQGGLSRLLTRTKGGTATTYVYAAGMLLYEETGALTRTYHFDYRGSTVALTGDNQLVSDRVFYGPYGETVARTGTTDTPFLYHGAHGVETDASKLCYMRARYYGTDSRRFLNADPLGFKGGMNWFAFVGCDPVNAVDPLGLEWYKPLTWGYPSWAPRSAGGSVTGDVTAAMPVGGHGEVTVGTGVFAGEKGTSNFLSHGESMGPGGIISPQNSGKQPQLNPHVGLNASIGAGLWLSNANRASELESTAKTVSLNISGWGVKLGGASLAYGSGIWQITYGPPGWGVGGGASISSQRTTTYTRNYPGGK